jgi:hypothetical protein
LYNIASDPSECHNLISQYPDKVAELEAIMVKEHQYDPNWPLLPGEFRK